MTAAILREVVTVIDTFFEFRIHVDSAVFVVREETFR